MNATRRELSGSELIPFDILPCAPQEDRDDDGDPIVANLQWKTRTRRNKS